MIARLIFRQLRASGVGLAIERRCEISELLKNSAVPGDCFQGGGAGHRVDRKIDTGGGTPR